MRPEVVTTATGNKMKSESGTKRVSSNRSCSRLMSRRQAVAVLASIVVAVVASFQLVDSLAFTSIQMPALVQRGTNFWLACQYELSSSSSSLVGHKPTEAGTGTDEDSLYSVKWYKNNEEFYRVLFNQNGASAGTGNSQPGTMDDSNSGNGSGNSSMGGQQFHSGGHHYQQQYFSQAGVNVLMSSSNATHVRLLNASLDSDGSYACEISTENLSTIRHEKEIKVYVLPHLKISVIGVKSLYSLGERVELNCLSDFSRPAGALAWFINGQRITSNLRPFELESSVKPKASERQLVRTSLLLKFTLTNETLLAFGRGKANQNRAHPVTLNGPTTTTTTTTTEQQHLQSRNQSLKSVSSGFAETNEVETQLLSSTISGGGNLPVKLFELFKLDCKYKLTDVSDVTFNELKVARAAGQQQQQQQLASSPQPYSASSSLPSSSSSSSSSSAQTTTSDNNYAPQLAATSGELSEQSQYRRRRRRRASQSLPSARHNGNSVSDNKLKLARHGRASTAAATASNSLPQLQAQHLRAVPLKLSKSHGNQVIQSSCPARRSQFEGQIWSHQQQQQQQQQGGLVDACLLGPLALQQDDPIIVESVGELQAEESDDVDELSSSAGGGGSDGGEEMDEERHGEEDSASRTHTTGGNLLELPEGALLQLNCSTLGALLADNDQRRPATYTNEQATAAEMDADSAGAGAAGQAQYGAWSLATSQARRGQALYMARNQYGQYNYRQRQHAPQRPDGFGSIAANYCNDSLARRKTLISGKHLIQLTNEATAAAVAHSANQRQKSSYLPALSSSSSSALSATLLNSPGVWQQQQRNQQIAYIVLDINGNNKRDESGGRGGATSTGNDYDEAHRQLLSLSSASSSSSFNRKLASDQSLVESALSATKSLAQLEQQHNHHYQRQQLSAPPLLEWFINNQEAPKSSASYAPELPLTLAQLLPLSLVNLAPISRGQQQAQGGGSGNSADYDHDEKGNNKQHNSLALDNRPLGDSGVAALHRGESLFATSAGTTLEDESSSVLPSIDYAQYFANFQARPVEQHLKLSLKLDKKHFATPDSMLTLRCTSTQAQVLTVDSFSVTFLAAPPSNGTGLGTIISEANIRRSKHQQHAATANSWQQRPVTANNNQIKPKYLHQYPRSSGTKISPQAATNHYHDQSGKFIRGPNTKSAADFINNGVVKIGAPSKIGDPFIPLVALLSLCLAFKFRKAPTDVFLIKAEVEKL